jgi:hypothetical protein
MFDFMAAFLQWNIVLSLLRLRIRIILFGYPVLDPDPLAIKMTNSDFSPTLSRYPNSSKTFVGKVPLFTQFRAYYLHQEKCNLLKSDWKREIISVKLLV